MRAKELDSLFQPIKVGTMTLKNRLIMAPMGTGFADENGNVNERELAYFGARARGGAGLITVVSSVDFPAGYLGRHELRVDNDSHISRLARLAKVIHDGGAKASLQLVHAGRYARSKITGEQPVAPSPIPSKYTGETPRELTASEVEVIIEEYGDAARRARAAGFDAVELLAATGYLVSQFLSPLTNKRADRFGGDLRGRATFAIEVLHNIRTKAGTDFPISFKMSVDEYMPGGNSIADSQAIAALAVGAGATMLHAWAGWHESPVAMLPMSVPRGAFVHLAEALKKATDAPVVAVGRVNDPILAARVISEGRADIVAMGRAFLADPSIASKAFEGRLREIRPCIACCKCFDNIMLSLADVNSGLSAACAVNAECGREWEKRIRPVEKVKKVLVIGGGPAGMEAARVAAARGHSVTLWEQADRLGGKLLLAMLPPHKEEIKGLVEYLCTQMELLGVEVIMNNQGTTAQVLAGRFDKVIVAAGGAPIVPSFPGLSSPITALDILRGTPVTGNVLIIGAGMVGCETAEFLVQKGIRVTLVEMAERIAQDVGPTSRWVLLKRLKEAGVEMLTNSRFAGLENGRPMVEINGRQKALEPGSVVLAVGMKPQRQLYDELAARIRGVQMIGDCSQCKTVHEAMHSAWEVGCTL